MTKKLNRQALNAERTLKKILSAARKLFVKNGFSGASIGKIAEKAQVNQSLIYHYFSNKAELWKRVKDDLLLNLSSSDQEIPYLDFENLDDFLTYLVRDRFDYYIKNPDIVRMLQWQQLEEDDQELTGLKGEKVENWLETIQKLQKKKEIDPEIAAKTVFTLIVGAAWSGIIFYPGILTQNFKEQEEYISTTIKLLKKAIQGA